MPKKSLLLSAIFFDCLGKAAVFCVHKLKEKVRVIADPHLSLHTH